MPGLIVVHKRLHGFGQTPTVLLDANCWVKPGDDELKNIGGRIIAFMSSA
ncbi:MAG: hypothetical protein JKY27_12450 [Magnetovibrio sp.]|nr:hypothetical protein [Magnetovibrio sp.]